MLRVTFMSMKTIRASNELERVTTPSLAALRKYVEGSRIADEENDSERGLALLEEAVQLDTSFAMAWQRIGSILDGDENARTRVHEALSRARALSDSVSEYERHLILGTYHMIVSGNLAEAAAEFRAPLSCLWRNFRARNDAEPP